MLLSGCSKSNKPDDISQEIWDEAIQVVLYIDKITKEPGLVDPNVTYGSYLLKEIEYSSAEENLYLDLIDLQMKSSILFSAIIEESKSLEECKKDYEEAYNNFEDLFGKRNLQKAKIDYEFLLNLATENGRL